MRSAKKFIFGHVWEVIVATLGVIFLLTMLYGFESVIEKKKSFIPVKLINQIFLLFARKPF